MRAMPGWCDRISDLIEDGWDRDEATDKVLIEYLGAGDVRPITYLLNHDGTPGPEVCKLLAAMLDPAGSTTAPPFQIRFETCRRGRPKKGIPHIDFADFRTVLKPDIEAMTVGHQPDRRFWQWLRYALKAWLDLDQAQEELVQRDKGRVERLQELIAGGMSRKRAIGTMVKSLPTAAFVRATIVQTEPGLGRPPDLGRSEQ
jgi:hypothetical protein